MTWTGLAISALGMLLLTFGEATAAVRDEDTSRCARLENHAGRNNRKIWSSAVVCNERYCGRLRTLFARLLHKVHLGADLEPAEARVYDAIRVEINLPAIRRLQETVALFREELADVGVRRALMDFQNSASTAGIILKLTARRVKSVPNRELDVIVRSVFAQFPALF